MRKLYEELLERYEYLKTKEETDITTAKILELQLVIVRVQQLLLDELNNEQQ